MHDEKHAKTIQARPMHAHVQRGSTQEFLAEVVITQAE